MCVGEGAWCAACAPAAVLLTGAGAAGWRRHRHAGDGEELLANFTERLLEAKRELAAAAGSGGGVSRWDLLRALCTVEGVYCPGLYEVEYESPAGPIKAIRPAEAGVPPVVRKATYRGDTLASSTVVRGRGGAGTACAASLA